MDQEVNETQLQVKFVTKQEQLAVSDTPYAIQGNVLPADLNKLVNAILKETHPELVKDIEFDFLVNGEILCVRLLEHLAEKGISTEDALEIEYLERFPAPKPKDCLMHDDWVASVHCHNNWIITGCYDNSVHLWSSKGKHTLAIPGHTSPVKAVAWVSIVDSTAVFVSGSHDQSAMLWQWDTATNAVSCVVACRGHNKGVECIAVSGDALRFATGSWDNSIKLWTTDLEEVDAVPAKKKARTDAGKQRMPQSSMTGHREAVSGVCWVDQGTLLSSSWDHSLRLWDCQLGGIKQEIAGNKAFFDADWSPLCNSIITASADRHIRLYDPRSTETLVKSTFTSHSGWVQAARWSTTHDTLFMSASYDGQVKLWETRSPRTPLYDLTGHDEKVLCCDWSNPSLMVSGGCDNTLRLFKSNKALQPSINNNQS